MASSQLGAEATVTHNLRPQLSFQKEGIWRRWGHDSRGGRGGVLWVCRSRLPGCVTKGLRAGFVRKGRSRTVFRIPQEGCQASGATSQL